SGAQARACRGHGLDVRLQDARHVTRDSFGGFDAVASLGAFEHFCSPDDYRAGRQQHVYRDFFERIASLLQPGGRIYLQTMVYGRNMIAAEQAVAALQTLPPAHTDAWYLAL